MIYLYLAFVVALVAGAVFAVNSYNSAISEAETAKASAATLQANLEDANENKKVLQEMLDDADRLAKESANRAKLAAANAAKLDEELKNARKAPEVAKWMDTPVPDPIRGLRRGSATDPANRDVLPSPGPAVSGNTRAPSK